MPTDRSATLAPYAHALSPTKIGRLDLRNRIFVPAHTTNFADNNLPSSRHVAYHRARAAGGAALIIYETIRVHPSTIGRQGATAGYDDSCIEPFSRVAAAVHAEGARIFGQIVHMGREIDGNYARSATWGPSEIPWSPTAAIPHAMTQADIDLVIKHHVEAARRLIVAGFDGVEVHLGHGHLLQQFLSPISNCRTDRYGGTVENRLRFAIEVFQAVRAEVGPEFPLGIRISAEEFIPGGLSLSDMGPITRMIVDQVDLDFVNVSHAAYHSSYSLATQMADMQFSSELFRTFPRVIAEHVADARYKPQIFAVCKFTGLAEADDVLADGAIAMVGMARAHIAEPQLVNKSIEGREADIRPCIQCNQGCVGMLQLGQAITCLVNPLAGREGEWDQAPAKVAHSKRVLVIGGGPAGLEAASMAALRGHSVTLWESAAQLGGEVRTLEAMPQRQDFLKLLASQIHRCKQAGVEISLGKRAVVDDVRSFAADVVLVATGASSEPMKFADGSTGQSMQEALTDIDRLGQRVAVVDTLGSWAIASVIEHLCNSGRDVTLFTPNGQIIWNVAIYSSFAWRKRVLDRGLKVVALKTIHGFREGVVTLEDAWSGELTDGGKFDAVIAPGPGSSRTSLYHEIEAAAFMPMSNVVLIGDALAPRTALEAVYEGHRAAWEL